MATSFDEIYCLNSVIKNDTRLIEKPDYEIYALYWKYLQLSIPQFEYDCLKNLNDYIPFSLTKYSFIGNGVDNIFELTPAPILTLTPDFYISKQITCGVKAVEETEYVWDSENNTITLTKDIPEIGSTIEIYLYEIGQFNEDLNLDEKRILANAMLIPYLQEQKDQRKLVNFAVYGGSIKMHSQAEHLKVLNETLQNQNEYVEGLINTYSYRTAPKRYPGLGGRTVCYHRNLYNQ